MPTRAELSTAEVRLFHQGGPTKADLLLVPWQGGRIVVKDFARKRFWVRLWGRWQVRREVAAYRVLEAVDGLPRFLGRLDRHALALEYVEGKSLHQCRSRERRRQRYFAELSRIVAEMHQHGVFHNDLRGKDNALVSQDGDQVLLVDLAGAVRLPPGSLRYRLLGSLLAQVDRAALLKWKVLLVPEEVTEEDRTFLRHFSRWRRWWMFNPKGHGPRRAV